MEWSPEIYKLYEKITAQTPEMFRPMVKPLLYKTAEKKCLDRNSGHVNEADLVTALLEITPGPFKLGAIDNLRALGIDTQKYTRPDGENEPIFIHKTDLQLLQDDIAKAAKIADVPYNKNIIHSILNAYRDFFSRNTITFRTTTKPKEKRKLSVRYVKFDVPRDPYPTALAEGFISKQEHPIYDLHPKIQSKYPVFGYGIDMDVEYGLSKIWSFMVPQPIEEVYAMSSLPDSIENHADYFSKYGLSMVSVFGLDFQNKTMNLYFMKKPGDFPPNKIAGMIGDLGFRVPTQEILGYCSKSTPIYFTFSWDSNRIERLCFGVGTTKPSQVPAHLHPLIERYTTQAPFQSEKHNFIYSITFGRTEDYIKIENDYTGSMINLMLSMP